MNTRPLTDLAATWREHAEALRRYGAGGPADALEACASELEGRVREWATAPLTLTEAAEESGYSVSRLQHMVGGDVPNAGEKGSPRIRRADLPRKPGGNGPRREDGTPDLATARAVRRMGG